jgi:hypothetical protein
MIAFSLTRPTRPEVIAELQAAFNNPAWQNTFIFRVEVELNDVGGVITARGALWGNEEEIERGLWGAGLIE